MLFLGQHPWVTLVPKSQPKNPFFKEILPSKEGNEQQVQPPAESASVVDLAQRPISTELATLGMSTGKGNPTEQPKKIIPANSTIMDLLKGLSSLVDQHQEMIDPAIMDLSTTTGSLSEQLQKLIHLLQANLVSSSVDNRPHAHVRLGLQKLITMFSNYPIEDQNIVL